MVKPKTDAQEIGLMVKEMVDGAASEFERMIQPVELPPEITDDQIKQALIDISPEGYEGLMQRMERQGVARSEVVHFIDQFMQRRRF